MVPGFTDPLLCLRQPFNQQCTGLLERQGLPESEGERDQLPAHFIIRGQRFQLGSQETQALFVATSHDDSDLDQGTQQAQTPLDQCYLCLGKQMGLLAVQDRFHTHDGSLHLCGHAGMYRFSADMDGVEEAQGCVESQARMHT